MTSFEYPQFCPEHGEPDKGPLWAWSCPDECAFFIDELIRRLDDIALGGNFFRMTMRRGVMMSQEFRNHRPVGRLRVAMPKVEARRRRISRMHSLYRTRRR